VPELLLILCVVVLLFGVNKLPQLGDALGKGIRSFRKAADRGLDEGDAPAAHDARPELPQGRRQPQG
jgi:sec-independent protein translocase protein TatA